jgi:hypothetical protein
LPAEPLKFRTLSYLLAAGSWRVKNLNVGWVPLGPVSGVVPGSPNSQTAESIARKPKKAVAAIR